MSKVFNVNEFYGDLVALYGTLSLKDMIVIAELTLAEIEEKADANEEDVTIRVGDSYSNLNYEATRWESSSSCEWESSETSGGSWDFE